VFYKTSDIIGYARPVGVVTKKMGAPINE